MRALNVLALDIGLAPACAALRINRAGIYRDNVVRRRLLSPLRPANPRPRAPLALSPLERQTVLEVLCSERFADCAPRTIYATLLDEGRYVGSVRTMYRQLAASAQSRERCNQRVHPAYAKPELLALQPNEVWSWDITKLKGPVKWSCYHLYVILDIFSRYVVGWMIALREAAHLAEQLIADTVAKHNIAPGTLTLHADRGSSMRSKPVAALLVDLEVTKTHSRPHVSDDNPYSDCSRVARGRRGGNARTVPAGHDRRRLRTDGNPCRPAVAAAQAMGDGLVRPIPAWAASRTCECTMGA
jgi:putative transposase